VGEGSGQPKESGKQAIGGRAGCNPLPKHLGVLNRSICERYLHRHKAPECADVRMCGK